MLYFSLIQRSYRHRHIGAGTCVIIGNKRTVRRDADIRVRHKQIQNDTKTERVKRWKTNYSTQWKPPPIR